MGLLLSGINLREAMNIKNGHNSVEEKDRVKLKHYCRIFQLNYDNEVALYTEIMDDVLSRDDSSEMRILTKKENFNRDGEFQVYLLWRDRADRAEHYARRFREASLRDDFFDDEQDDELPAGTTGLRFPERERPF